MATPIPLVSASVMPATMDSSVIWSVPVTVAVIQILLPVDVTTTNMKAIWDFSVRLQVAQDSMGTVTDMECVKEWTKSVPVTLDGGDLTAANQTALEKQKVAQVRDMIGR